MNHAGPDALSEGDQFSLFTADLYDGAFSSVALPAPGAGLAWTNRLAEDGSIAVVAAATPLAFSHVTASGSQLVLRGSGGTANGTYYLFAATNVAQPVAQWSVIATNQFNGAGNFEVTNVIQPGVPQRFFRMLGQ